jgi:hypothetical protein
LPDIVANELNSVFLKKFFWKPGEYQAVMSADVEGTRYERRFIFQISEGLSSRLLAAKNELKNCFGIGIPIELPALDSLYVQKGDITNFAPVTVK